MPDRLSVLIPARCEQFLQKTIQCVLDAAQGDVEVIAVCDGYWPDPPVLDAPSVVVLHYTAPVGQRAAVNRAAKIATGKYIMKLDAHCDVAPGFDTVLKRDCKYEWTMVPRMYNLDVTTWLPKKDRRTDYMYISGPNHKDGDKPYGLRAMYYGHWGGVVSPKIESKEQIDDTMCCMGPCWFMHMDRFWELGGLDEGHGGWGQMGVEVALKAWLSGGALKVNKRTWFSHWFRGGGVPQGFKSGFPYSISGKDVERARAYSQDLWVNNKWPKQVRTLEWLVDKFHPPTWNSNGVLTCPLPEKPLLSVVIPSWKDPLLHKTISGILENFETDYEIIPVLDGYDPAEPLPNDPRVRPMRLLKNVGMRGAINAGVKAARGKYIMRTDEHCMFSKGFDKTILSKIEDNQIVTARRYYLDPVKWEVMQEEDFVDYEKMVLKETPEYKKLASVAWISRTKERAEIDYDETMTMQGSVWIMPRSWWDKVIGELQTEGYGTHYQDTTEMLFKTWKAGGKLMLNKAAWFAHKHRSFPRTHHYSTEKATPEWLYALNKWWSDYEKVKSEWRI